MVKIKIKIKSHILLVINLKVEPVLIGVRYRMALILIGARYSLALMHKGLVLLRQGSHHQCIYRTLT